jgi:hypothetical protein
MLTISKTNQIIIGTVLAILVITTRGNHFASINLLPSASLAVFFLAGFYLRPNWAFAAFLALCVGLDYSAITISGVSNYCVTPAYGFLLPAYGVMWFAGRWFAQHYHFSGKAILPLVCSVSLASALSELFSSGGFYFFGGRFAETSISEFGARLVKYFPQQIEGIAFWLVAAFALHVAFTFASNTKRVQA